MFFFKYQITFPSTLPSPTTQLPLPPFYMIFDNSSVWLAGSQPDPSFHLPLTIQPPLPPLHRTSLKSHVLQRRPLDGGVPFIKKFETMEHPLSSSPP